MGLFDSIGDFFSDVPIVGPVVSGLFGMSAADAAGDRAERLQSEANANSAYQTQVAFDRSMQAYRTRYQNTMADMRAAGLNPILAASGGFNVGNAPSAAPAQTFMQSYVPNYASSARDVGDVFKESADTALSVAQRPKVQAEIGKINQDVRESVERVYLMREQANLTSAQEKETYQKMVESSKRIDVMSSEVFKINQEIRESVSRESLNYSSRALADSGVELNRAKMREVDALIGKIGAEVFNLQKQGVELSAIADAYKGAEGKTLVLKEKLGKAGYLGNVLGTSYGGDRPFKPFELTDELRRK